MIRRALEKLMQGRTLKRHIHVGGRNWPIIVSPDAQLKYLKPGAGSFDQDLVQLAEHYLKPASQVWDVGANVGTFTVAAAAIATQGHVLGIEADIWLAQVLRKTALAPCFAGRIEILPCAASGSDGTATFMIAKRGRASNALADAGGRSQMGGVREMQTVPTLTLDTLLDQRPMPDFIKIDVEGAELEVLKGASKLLAARHATLYIEIGEDVGDAIMALMSGHGYQAIDPVTRQPSDRWLSNTLFVPGSGL